MTRDALMERVGELADAVLADPRWERDDLSVTVLGQIPPRLLDGRRQIGRPSWWFQFGTFWVETLVI